MDWKPGLPHMKPFKGLLHISADEEYIPFPKKSRVVVDLENYYDGYGHESELNYRVFVINNHTHLLHKPLLITSQWHGSSGKVLWDLQTTIEKGLLIRSTKLLNNTRRFWVIAKGDDGFHEIGEDHLRLYSTQDDSAKKDKDELTLKMDTESLYQIIIPQQT